MAGMPQAMISVVCPRGWVAMDVQPVAVTTVAPVSAPAMTGPMALSSCLVWEIAFSTLEDFP